MSVVCVGGQFYQNWKAEDHRLKRITTITAVPLKLSNEEETTKINKLEILQHCIYKILFALDH